MVVGKIGEDPKHVFTFKETEVCVPADIESAKNDACNAANVLYKANGIVSNTANLECTHRKVSGLWCADVIKKNRYSGMPNGSYQEQLQKFAKKWLYEGIERDFVLPRRKDIGLQTARRINSRYEKYAIRLRKIKAAGEEIDYVPIIAEYLIDSILEKKVLVILVKSGKIDSLLEEMIKIIRETNDFDRGGVMYGIKKTFDKVHKELGFENPLDTSRWKALH